MNKPISIILPTYRESNYLNICLESIVKGQVNINQIIVIVDGFYQENKEVLDRWKDKIDTVNLEENVGFCRAVNIGVANAKHDLILIVNDDNVFPSKFDSRLLADYKEGMVLSVNQIEPFQSIYPQFYIKDLGRNSKTFDLSNFCEEENMISMTYGRQKGGVDNTGSLLPILLNKYDFLKVGGFDIEYPRTGSVADYDILLKLTMCGHQMMRTYNVHLYHFVTGTSNTPEAVLKRQQDEQQGWAYSQYKWGARIINDPYTNKKYLAS